MQDLGRGSFGLRPVGQVNRKGDDEFVAVEPCHNRLLRDNADDRRSGLAEHFIARFIAMPVVDRLEAMQPNRRDAPAAATCRKSLPQLFAAVAQTFAIGQTGDDVARGDMCRSSLGIGIGIGAFILLVLKIGEPPVDQDQCDILGQNGHREANAFA